MKARKYWTGIGLIGGWDVSIDEWDSEGDEREIVGIE